MTVATPLHPPAFSLQCEAIGAEYHHDPLPRTGDRSRFDIEILACATRTTYNGLSGAG